MLWLTVGLPAAITALRLIEWITYLRFIERLLRNHGAVGLRQAASAVDAWPKRHRPTSKRRDAG